jgi:acetyltransferase-like isoleucine patch superfamily enzyme
MGTIPTILNKVFVHLRLYYTYYWKYKADLASYLRARGAQIGKNCDFLGGMSTFNSAEPYLIHMGNKVTITQGVLFVTHDGGTRVFRDLTPDWKTGTVKMGPIEIGDNVFIGVGSIILPNVKIGSNVVIGAGAVVSKEIPSNVVAVGVPARIICSIEEYARRSLDESITIPDEFITDRQSYLIRYFWDQVHDK